ncbi:MATH domain and coiled-coil domain-containing protein At3g58440 [Capsella rubella]|nr:MATH domain and coiled-coil domain-containing protein At3g58440 [Capsella rubella]
MQEKFTWVLGNFSSLKDWESNRYSLPFTVGSFSWRLNAYRRGVYYDRSYVDLAVYLYFTPGSPLPERGTIVKHRITLVNVSPRYNKVLGERCFLNDEYISSFEDFLPLDQLSNPLGGFLVNDRLTIVAEVDVLPDIVVPAEVTASVNSKEASLSKSQGDSPSHQVAQDNATSQDKLDNDDASEDGTDNDDDASQESSDYDYDDDDDDDDDDASEESLDDDEDDYEESSDDDDDADDGGSGITPLNQLNALEDLSLKEENNGISYNTVVAVAESDQVSKGENDDASKEDVDDESSSLVLNVNQVKSLQDVSQTMENSGKGINTVASETCDNVLMEIQPVKETMDINGFEVVSSKVESVRRIFENHPDIAVEFRVKNQHLRNACMNFLLSLIETMCQSLEELSNEDLVEADIALTYLRDAGFKVDWLEKKLDQVKEKKEEEQSGLARLHEIEENLMILKQKWSDLDALAEKEKTELSATRSALSFDDLVC